MHAQGVVAPWSGRFASVDAANAFAEDLRTHERWVGRPKNGGTLGRYLSRDLEVSQAARVVALDGEPEAWTLVDQDEHHHGLSCHAHELSRAASCNAPCRAQRAAPLPPHALCRLLGGLVRAHRSEPFAWDSLSFEAGTLGEAFRSNSKPERSGAERWVVHAAPDWSSAHRHDPPEVVAQSLTEAFEEATGQKVHTMTVHR